MDTATTTGVGRISGRPEEERQNSPLGPITMLYYGWFYTAGVALSGLGLLFFGDDALLAQRVLVGAGLLLGIQCLMEYIRHRWVRFYDGLAMSRVRTEIYIWSAAALVWTAGGLHSPYWLLFVLPIALAAVYNDGSVLYRRLILAQILLVDALATWRAGPPWMDNAIQGALYAAVFAALLESANWSYVLAHFRQKEHLQHLELLRGSAQKLIAHLSLAELTHEALAIALRLANARQGFLLITQQDTGRLLAHEFVGLSLSQGVTAQELANRSRSLAARNVHHYKRGADALYGHCFHDRIESALMVPISTARGGVATLHIVAPDVGGFLSPVQSLLEVFANQFATALDNALSWEDQERSLRHYRSLIELGQRLMERLDPQPILEQAVHYVRDALPYVTGAYVFWQDSRSCLYTQVARSGLDLGQAALTGVPLHRLFSSAGEPPSDQMVLSLPEVDAARWGAAGLSQPSPFGSLLAIQLRVGAKLVGLMVLGATEPKSFPAVDQVFLGNLAGHVALAYRNAELHQRQQTNRGRLARILQERTAWRLDQSRLALLDQMAHSAVRALGFGAAVIDLYDPLRGGYATQAVANLPFEIEERLRDRVITRDQVARALRSEFRVDNANVYFIPAERHVPDLEWPRLRQTLSGAAYLGPSQWRAEDLLLVPLRRADGIQVGLLRLDNPDDKTRPSTDEAHVLENLADQLVAALEQWHQDDKLRQLSETLAGLIDKTDAAPLYQFIAGAGAHLLEAESCTLFLHNERNGTIGFEASSQLSKDEIERKEYPISDAQGAGLVPFVASTGTALNFVGEEYKVHSAWEGHFQAGYPPTRNCRSLALVALRDPKGPITGVLSVENKQGIDAGLGFSEFDREILLPTLANATAIAVERANLARRTEDLFVQKERVRLAGELHDLANVFAMGVQLPVEKLWDQMRKTDQHEAAQALQRLWRASRYVCGELKKMHEETRHPILVHEGLMEALQNYSETIHLAGVQFADRIGDRLPVDVEHALYRVGQEALSNARKHSQGAARNNRVLVSLEKQGQNTVLQVSDNGPGFDVERELRRPESFGLTRMMEIAEGIKAQCLINSTPGQGTVVSVVVPTQEKEGALVKKEEKV